MSDPIVPIRLNSSDRAALRAVAEHFQKNKSETIRLLVRGMHAVLQEQQLEQRSQSSAGTNNARAGQIQL